MRLAILLLGLSLSAQVSAAWWDWWRNADQQGKTLLDSGDPARAAQVFNDPRWRGAAQFQAGEFEQAADEFARAEGAEALYNRATSLAHAGDLRESLAAFDNLLQQQPQHEDGIANREWVRRQLEQQQQQEQQNGEGGESQDGQRNQPSQARNEQQTDSENRQQQSGNTPNDDRKPGQENNANSQQGQQSAEESLKSALQDQREPDRPTPAEAQGEESADSGERASAMPNTEISYSEESQAIEQQLQRIPDDPAGLLRNKLYVTHQSRYADIREGEEPW